MYTDTFEAIMYPIFATELRMYGFNGFEHHECFVCGEQTYNSQSLMLNAGDDAFTLAKIRAELFSDESTMFIPESHPTLEDEGSLLIAVLTCPKHHQHAQLLQGLIESDYGSAGVDSALVEMARSTELLCHVIHHLKMAIRNVHKAREAAKSGDTRGYNNHVHLALEFVEDLGTQGIAYLPIYEKIAGKLSPYNYLNSDPQLFKHNREMTELYLRRPRNYLPSQLKKEVLALVDRELTAKNAALQCSHGVFQPAADHVRRVVRVGCEMTLRHLVATVIQKNI